MQLLSPRRLPQLLALLALLMLGGTLYRHLHTPTSTVRRELEVTGSPQQEVTSTPLQVKSAASGETAAGSLPPTERGPAATSHAGVPDAELYPCPDGHRTIRLTDQTLKSTPYYDGEQAVAAFNDVMARVIGNIRFDPTGDHVLAFRFHHEQLTPAGEPFTRQSLEVTLQEPSGRILYTRRWTTISQAVYEGADLKARAHRNVESLASEAIRAMETVIVNKLPCPLTAEQLSDCTSSDPSSIPPELPADPADSQYHALLIGLTHYQNAAHNLVTPGADIRALKDVLARTYGFSHFHVLLDDQATRAGILNTLEQLASTLEPTDNLLIYYAGHGQVASGGEREGYWLPFDARFDASSTDTWVANREILERLKGLKSHHVLLVSDSCYSGRFVMEERGGVLAAEETTGGYFERIQRRKSRQCFTSGGLEPVADGGGGGHSIFAFHLLKALESQSQRYTTARALFSKVSQAVERESTIRQRPNFRRLEGVGHEACGDFILVKR